MTGTSAVSNFLVSIYNNQLVVDVCGEVISKETLSETVKELHNWASNFRDRSILDQCQNMENFFRVLTDNKKITTSLSDNFLKYDFIEKTSDATLMILKHDNANRTVLQTRKAGMKINGRNRINGNINFSGIFQATGTKLNAFLKRLESADHDKWSADRLRDGEEKKARNFLGDLLRFYKATVKDNFDSTDIDEINAFGIKSLLPMTDEGNGSGHVDKGIQSIFTGKVDTEEPTDVANVLDGDREDKELRNVLESSGIGLGETSGPGSSRLGGSNGNSPDNHYGVGGGEEGQKGISNDGEQLIIEGKQHISINEKVLMKVIELNHSEGKYRLILKPVQDIQLSEVDLRYIGADGKGYAMLIEKAKLNGKFIPIVKNKIIVENLVKNKKVKIDCIVKSKLRMKMEGIINEVKS